MKPTQQNTRSKGQSPAMGERSSLLRSLEDTKQELDLAHLGFNQSTDPDLIEFYLYEIDALRARHTYLLRRIKALDAGVQMPPSPARHPGQLHPPNETIP